MIPRCAGRSGHGLKTPINESQCLLNDRMDYRDMKIVVLILLTCGLALFEGCATRDFVAEADAKKTKVGIVFDIGGKDDRSFNAAANTGVLRAKKDLPIILRDVEPGDPTSIEPALRAFAQYGYNLITGVGFAQGPILKEVAMDYPQLHFVLIDAVAD